MSNYYAGKRILITGGLGFIGSHLAVSLAQRGAKITIIDALLPTGGGKLSHVDSVRDSIDIQCVDLRDTDKIGPLVRDQSIIFSLAAQTSHIESMEDPMLDLELNGRSQLSLLEACRRENPNTRLVFTSTRQVYGRAQYLPVDEEHAVSPSDINGVHKLTAESYLQLFSRVYGLASSVLRLTNTYGPHMDLHPRKGFIGVFVDCALRGETIRLFGDGLQLRDFNYVSDVVSALELVGEHAGPGFQIFNMGHDEHLSLRQFVETLSAIQPLTFLCQPFPDNLKRIDIGDYYGSYDKLQRLTGWRPQVSLHEGLLRTVLYFRRKLDSSPARPVDTGKSAGTSPRVPNFEYRGELSKYRTEILSRFARVLDSGKLILGQEVSAFEAEFAQFVGATHAVGVSSGTDALIVALRALDIGQGDEVITVANGPAPTVAAIRAVGACPRLIDIDPVTMQMNASHIEDAINARSRCLLPLHLYGYPCDIQRLLELSRRYGLRLIEDCAQAHGAYVERQHVGLFGDIGCYSFYPTKNLGAFGDAGLCVTHDEVLAQRMREHACYGFRGDRIAHVDGLNCRLDELQAAALRVRLRYLPEGLCRRQAIAERYLQELKHLPVQLPVIIDRAKSAWHQFVIRTTARPELIEHLAQLGIDVGIHYATPIHHMPAYARLNLVSRSLATTEKACREVLSLPAYPELSDEHVERVIAGVQSFFRPK